MVFLLSGTLEADAPGIWQRLLRTSGPTVRLEIAELYQRLFEQGLVLEAEIPRPTGVSFASRPVRIATLALEFIPQKTDRDTIAAALLVGCTLLPSLHTLPPTFAAAHDLATIAQQYPPPGERLPPVAASLAAIRLLDDIRHLHQRPDAEQARTAYRVCAQRLAALNDSIEHEKLRTLLQAGLERYERFGSKLVNG